ncbi:protocadherin beta-16-like [Sander lucioperca]|uniref:protocadherin beta-16-like n=1 Tax=Sander lucioperca TaxID=283035 RepID=UPI001653CE04|nr:protocadherin beta-16-like [Sander lucioperca]
MATRGSLTYLCSRWPLFYGLRRQIGLLMFLLHVVNMVGGQIRYSIPEEMKKGSVIGNVAQDLGLDLKRLRSGRARIVTGENIHYTELKTDKGILVVNERIDREQLCGDVTPCSFSFEVILENPMELHRITVEVLDINDHAPVFPNKEKTISLDIGESAAVGVQFPLQSADDLDVGQNALQDYILSPNDNFILKQHANPDGGKYVEMVLQRSLDREQHPHLSLKLIAVDGGTPQRSGTVNIDITVLDANDNVPVFNQSVYKASVMENTTKGTSIITVNATDADSGSNGLITYSLSKTKGSAGNIFTIDENTGTVSVSGQIDYEKDRKYEVRVEAKDQGGLTGTSKIILDVVDVNDNAPVINIMSFSSPVSEDALPGTTVAILNIKDADSDKNGQIKCSIDGKLPFKIESSLTNYYNLISDQHFDRESVSEYNITIIATDLGSPPLSSSTKLHLKISDVNDNAPLFDKNGYSAYITENNSPGISIFAVSARDSDWNQNARISYLLEDTQVSGSPVSTYVSLNSETGVLTAVRSFDYEQIKQLQIVVKAQDGGSPPLSSNVTVKILIQDQNDNPPQVLYPVQTGGSLVAEMVPRSADVGYLVTKVVAVDVDSGQNAWLSYKLQKATDRALFEVGLQNGEIRTIRQVTDKDAVKQRLTVIVEDNGQPSRSATVIVNMAVADSFPEVLSEFTDFTHDKEYNDNLTFYLVLSLAVVSFLFITCLVVIISVKIYRWRQSRILYHSNLPVIPYYPPRYSDTLGTGTLQHVYNYEVCRTTDSRKSDCKFDRAGSQNVLIMDPRSTGTMQRIQSEKNILDEPDSPLELSSVTGQARYSVPEEQAEGSFVGNIARDLGLDVARLISGTTIAVINVDDEDSERNGVVKCSINSDIPFKIESSLTGYYTIVTEDVLDRESISEYNITITVSDQGSPPLTSSKNINVKVSDVNDSPPKFDQSEYSKTVPENNSPGLSVFTISAKDADWGQNARVSYFLEEKEINGVAVSSLVSVNSENGVIHAVRSFDYEQIKWFEFNITARDAGSPPLSSVATVKILIQDQNDNPPQVLYPVQTGGSLVAEMVPRSADVGYLVTKVVAVDVDSGQNAWLSYKLQKATDRALFEVGSQNGEIRTIRQVTDKDAVKQRLTVIVEDNGQPSRSATVIVNVAVADSFPEVLSEFTDFTHDKEYNDNLTFYLVLALAVVSFLFITCLVVIISVKIYRWRQSRILYHSNLPVIPYYPPRYSDTLGTGTLQHVYNYEVCRTTDSRKSDCKFGRAGSQNVLIMDSSSTGTMQRIQSEKSILDEPDSPLEHHSVDSSFLSESAFWLKNFPPSS